VKRIAPGRGFFCKPGGLDGQPVPRLRAIDNTIDEWYFPSLEPARTTTAKGPRLANRPGLARPVLAGLSHRTLPRWPALGAGKSSCPDYPAGPRDLDRIMSPSLPYKEEPK